MIVKEQVLVPRNIQYYQVVTANSTPLLEDAVNLAIHQGWQPQGGLIAYLPSFGHPSPKFSQAMVKYSC